LSNTDVRCPECGDPFADVESWQRHNLVTHMARAQREASERPKRTPHVDAPANSPAPPNPAPAPTIPNTIASPTDAVPPAPTLVPGYAQADGATGSAD
jgi:hypothetical protein